MDQKTQSKILEHGKLPPQALDVEEAVLGALMLEKDAFDEIYEHIDHRSFYKQGHQEIFKAIRAIYDRSEPIDIITVSTELSKANKLEDAGGPIYVTKLTSKVATAANIVFHAKILKQTALQRDLIRFGSEVVKRAYDMSADVADTVEYSAGQFDKITEFIYGAGREYTFGELLQQSEKQLEEREKAMKDGKPTGVPTPIQKLSKLTGGWQDGDLIVVSGRPSMGKTAVALEFIKTAAKFGIPVNVYSLEMRGVTLVDRMLCGEADLDPERFRNGYVSPEEWERIEKAIAKLEKLGIHVDDEPMVTMEYIRAKSRIKKRKDECGMIVIDYLQLVDSPEERGRNREQEVAQMSRKAKLIAKELNVPVILLAQLNRSCEIRGGDKRPQLSDLRESGAIEQDADVVILLYRAERYGIEEMEINGNLVSTQGLGEFILAKQRNGRTGTVEFGYNESLTRIYDYMNTDGYTDRDMNPPVNYAEPVREEPDMPF